MKKAEIDSGKRAGVPTEVAAVLYTLIQTAGLNDIDPQAWLADVLARIASHPIRLLDELLPWKWRLQPDAIAA